PRGAARPQAVGRDNEGGAGPGGAADEVDQQPVELAPVDGPGSGHDHPPLPGRAPPGPTSPSRPPGAAPPWSTTALAACRLAWYRERAARASDASGNGPSCSAAGAAWPGRRSSGAGGAGGTRRA